MVYVFLADGFEEIEAITPVDIMRRANIEVTTVGVTGKTVTGAHGIEVSADIVLSEADTSDSELIFLPGGMPGTTNLMEDKRVEKIILSAVEKKIYIAAICAAPMILGKLGILNGKRAVCFPGFEKYLEGSKVENCGVVCDGKIITAKGAGVAHKLGFKLVELLCEKAAAEELRLAMQFVEEI